MSYTIFNYFGAISDGSGSMFFSKEMYGVILGVILTSFVNWLNNSQKRKYDKQDKMLTRLEDLYSLVDKCMYYLDTILLLSSNGIVSGKLIKDGLPDIKKIPSYEKPIQKVTTKIKMILNLYFKEVLSNPFGKENILLNNVFGAIEIICNVEQISHERNVVQLGSNPDSDAVGNFLIEREKNFHNLSNSLYKFKKEIACLAGKNK